MDEDMETTPEEDPGPPGQNSRADVKKPTTNPRTTLPESSRPGRLTISQKGVLTKFLASHIECALGHPSQIADPEEKSKVTFLWLELTHKLNSVDGPTKTVSQWQNTFHRLKCQLKTKLMSLKAAGKEEMRQKLTPVDVKLLSIFKAAETRKEKLQSLQGKNVPATKPGSDTQETEVIILEEINETETSENAGKSTANDGDGSEVHFIQLSDVSADAKCPVNVIIPSHQVTVEDAKEPLEMSSLPPPPPPTQPSRKPRPVIPESRRRFPTHRGQNSKPFIRRLPATPTTRPPPPTTPLARPTRPTPQKSLLIEKKEKKEAREAERQMINSLFRRLIESHEASNQLKSKEIELLEKEKKMRENERKDTNEPAVPDEDELFLKTLIPYMKKLSDARRLKLRSDYQILLMQALQEEPDDSPPNKRSKKHYT